MKEKILALLQAQFAGVRKDGLNHIANVDNFKAKALKDFARMTFETDEAFTEYLTDTEVDIKAVNQHLADNGMANFKPPGVNNGGDGGSGKEATDAEISAIMDKLPI